MLSPLPSLSLSLMVSFDDSAFSEHDFKLVLQVFDIDHERRRQRLALALRKAAVLGADRFPADQAERARFFLLSCHLRSRFPGKGVGSRHAFLASSSAASFAAHSAIENFGSGLAVGVGVGVLTSAGLFVSTPFSV